MEAVNRTKILAQLSPHAPWINQCAVQMVKAAVVQERIAQQLSAAQEHL